MRLSCYVPSQIIPKSRVVHLEDKQILKRHTHSCQPLVQSLWTCISLMQAGVFCIFAGGSGILNSDWHVWQRKEEAMLCKIHMHDFKSHFWQDFLAYCTRLVSVHLAMVFVGSSFDSFWIFWISLKQQQNLMKIMFSCIHLPIWPYPPKIMIFLYFIQVNCMCWQVWYTI